MGHWATTSPREGAAGSPVSQETSLRPQSQKALVERGGNLPIKHKIALLGAITAALAAPAAALGAANHSVKVRVEGSSRTLLPTTLVHLHAGWITKGAVAKGACSSLSGAGALDAATHHHWSGSYSSSQADYFVTRILGETHGGKALFWDIFVNNVAATTGACAIKPHAGDQILFAAVASTDFGDYPLLISGAPRSARAGHPFKVKVLYVNALGKKVALSGARVTGTDFAAVSTGASGSATITPLKSGRLTLAAKHGATMRGGHSYGYVRSPSLMLHVSA
jgi:hypothetical protein